jgi:Flp pilus assembly protein CpaB
VVALLLAVAAASFVAAERPPVTHTTSAVVARHDLPAGATLAASDLTVAAFPDALVPDGALRSVKAAVGATLTAAVRRGEVLTDVRAQAGYADSLAPGEAAAPLRLADGGVAAVLRVGERVDVVASGRNAASRTLVTSARVIAVPEASSSTDPLSGTLVVLAVPADLAAAVVGASADASLSVVLH